MAPAPPQSPQAPIANQHPLDLLRGRGQIDFRHAVRISVGRAIRDRVRMSISVGYTIVATLVGSYWASSGIVVEQERPQRGQKMSSPGRTEGSPGRAQRHNARPRKPLAGRSSTQNLFYPSRKESVYNSEGLN